MWTGIKAINIAMIALPAKDLVRGITNKMARKISIKPVA